MSRNQGRGANDAGVEEDFLYHLFRGGELLGANQAAEALAELERAHDLRPDSAKAQGLLGLACFKLGHLERAGQLYEALVHDNPTDATLRVNLGLVHLKAGMLDGAIRELSTAAELEPEHPKTWNYLGLAQTQAGHLDLALEAFKRAGNRAMIEKLERPERLAALPPAAPR
ncbi:MAG: tetratricopeptide repeat protein, partial [Deltaproteobacteria bacterium]